MENCSVSSTSVYASREGEDDLGTGDSFLEFIPTGVVRRESFEEDCDLRIELEDDGDARPSRVDPLGDMLHRKTNWIQKSDRNRLQKERKKEKGTLRNAKEIVTNCPLGCFFCSLIKHSNRSNDENSSKKQK